MSKIISTPTKWFLLVLLALLVIGALIFEMQAHQRFNEVDRELDKLEHASINPVNGVADKTALYNTRHIGALEDILTCIDQQCPFAQKTWYIPIEPGQEAKFVNDILIKNGYTPDALSQKQYQDNSCDLQKTNACSSRGRKGKFNLDASIDVVYNDPAPSQDVSPKVWRRVMVSSSLY